VNLGKDKVHRHNINYTKNLIKRMNLVNLETTPGASCAPARQADLDWFGGMDEAVEEYRRGPGHRRFARRRPWCWPQQDDQRAQSKLVGRPLVALDQALER
jgi:hypothetical protein